jgi:hypothetical protein
MTLMAKLALVYLRVRYRHTRDSRVLSCDISSGCDTHHTLPGIIDQVFAALFFAGLTTRFFSDESCDAHHSEFYAKPTR